jgi:hypothetical protein
MQHVIAGIEFSPTDEAEGRAVMVLGSGCSTWSCCTTTTCC